MKPLSEEELRIAAEDAWQKTSLMAISHDAFIAAYKQGYAKCIWQMSEEFNGLISVFEALYAEQMKGDTTDKERYFVGVDVGEGNDKTGFIEMQNSKPS
jgi:hypothetical protein